MTSNPTSHEIYSLLANYRTGDNAATGPAVPGKPVPCPSTDQTQCGFTSVISGATLDNISMFPSVVQSI